MFGDYTCKAENHLGTLERVIILSEGAKPLQPKAKVILEKIQKPGRRKTHINTCFLPKFRSVEGLHNKLYPMGYLIYIY